MTNVEIGKLTSFGIVSEVIVEEVVAEVIAGEEDEETEEVEILIPVVPVDQGHLLDDGTLETEEDSVVHLPEMQTHTFLAVVAVDEGTNHVADRHLQQYHLLARYRGRYLVLHLSAADALHRSPNHLLHAEDLQSEDPPLPKDTAVVMVVVAVAGEVAPTVATDVDHIHHLMHQDLLPHPASADDQTQ